MRRIIIYTILLVAFLFSGLTSYSQNINKPNVFGPAGLEVNTYSGNLFYKRTDLVIPGREPFIDITFYYNSSRTLLDFGYGPGWSMTYSMVCKPQNNDVIVRHADGRKEVYTAAVNGINYIAPIGIFDVLTQYESGKFMLRTKTGMKYFFDDSTHHRLTSIKSRNNNILTISYTDSLATTITDPSGRQVNLSYENGSLRFITDPNTSPPRQFEYERNFQSNTRRRTNLINTITTSRVTNPLGFITSYEYNVNAMTLLTEPSSNQIVIGYTFFTTVKRILDSGKGMFFEYHLLTNETSYRQESDPGGSQQITTYKFGSNVSKRGNDDNLIEMEGSCCGYHQLFSWDANKNLINRIDANGNRYLYNDYDNFGNCGKVVQPDGGEWLYTYNGYSQVISSTDPRGNTTLKKYDVNGNLLEVNKPLNITEHSTYNNFGEEISHTDGNGNSTLYERNNYGYITRIEYPATTEGSSGATETNEYDNVGNLISHTDANGNTTTYKYDLLNRLTQMTDALGFKTFYAYDAQDNLISVTDPLGHLTTHTYDEMNLRTSTSTPAGTTSQTYDVFENKITFKDGNGNVTRYRYNQQNLMDLETNPLGNSRSFEYDGNGNKTFETDFSGNGTVYAYDALNRLVQVTDALSNKTTYTYDFNGNRISVKDANGNTTSYIYDALNRMVKMQLPIGIVTYGYDGNGNKITETDPNGHTTTYIYDSRNRQISVKDALGNSTIYAYDPQGNNTSITDRNNHTTSYSYDALNRRISETNPVGEVTITTYNPVGKISSQTTSTGNTILYTYDAADREIFAVDNIGAIETKTYDANSNVTSLTDGNGHTTTSVYNTLNKVVTAIDPMGRSTRYTYNNNTSLTSRQDKNGNITIFNYDLLERRISEVSPIGTIISRTFDAVGNIASMTDDRGNRTTYLYDANNRLVSETYANGSIKKYTYDAAGNRISRKDNNGIVTTYTYDILNRLISRNYPGSNDDNLSYDNEGNMIAANNINANITFTYDDANRISSEIMNGKVTIYTNSMTNRKRTITYPGGRNISEDYDFRFRLSAIKDGGTILANYKYDVGNRVLSRSYSNGVAANYAYNNNDWVTSLKHVRNLTTIIARFNYNFDNEGNKLFEEKTLRPTNSEKYSYDADYRLTNFKKGTLIGGEIPNPLTQTNYEYDGVGNRKTVVQDANTPDTYFSNSVNEYTSIIGSTTVTPTYDLNGNTLTDGIHSYSYDFENRLITVDGGATASYKYDALGRRIQKNTVSGTINYYYDNQRIIEERNSSDIVTATYVYGTVIDDILNMRRNNINYFYHQNSLGSIAAITDNTGAVVERYEYDAYGNPSIYSGIYTGTYYTDNFDGANDTASLRARGYKSYYRGTGPQAASQEWTNGDASIFPAFNGPPTGYVRGSYEVATGANNIDNWLVLPANDVTIGDSLFFYSRARGNLGHADSIRVMYSAMGDSVPEGASWVELGRFKVNIGAWQRRGFKAPSSGSKARFAIRYTVVNGGPNGTNSDYFGIDALTIEGHALASAIGNTYMFTGREFDVETGNYHYRIRFYTPDWGRFNQRDLLGFIDGMNLYGYAGNNPINLIDPLGKKAQAVGSCYCRLEIKQFVKGNFTKLRRRDEKGKVVAEWGGQHDDYWFGDPGYVYNACQTDQTTPTDFVAKNKCNNCVPTYEFKCEITAGPKDPKDPKKDLDVKEIPIFYSTEGKRCGINFPAKGNYTIKVTVKMICKCTNDGSVRECTDDHSLVFRYTPGGNSDLVDPPVDPPIKK